MLCYNITVHSVADESPVEDCDEMSVKERSKRYIILKLRLRLTFSQVMTLARCPLQARREVSVLVLLV